jgi:hypothetical protein
MSKTEKRPLLVIAHPGHELRVYGWLETKRPDVWVITDGSGRTGNSRINSTTRVLETTGSRRGRVYGQMTDACLYEAVLNFEHRHFTNLVDDLASHLIEADVDCVVGDAAEGYNPAHDTCRLVINAAVELARCTSKKQIFNYDFSLTGAPSGSSDDSLWFHLDDAAFSRKISAARNYPELQREVDAALAGSELFQEHPGLDRQKHETFGSVEASDFRAECLRPVNGHSVSTVSSNGHQPFYETYGEKQVKAGHYKRVLRYLEHMRPLAAALASHVERSMIAAFAMLGVMI